MNVLKKNKKKNNILDITTNSSFLKTESIINNDNQNEPNSKYKEVDEIILKYLEIKNKLNELWNKLD